MNEFHRIHIRVFVREVDDIDAIEEGLRDFFPFSLADEKVAVEKDKSAGLDDVVITICSVTLTKKRHLNAFVKHFFGDMKPEIRDTLKAQFESRLDDTMRFFVRFDKRHWLKDRTPILVDHGDCFHITFTTACYPKNRSEARKIVSTLLNA